MPRTLFLFADCRLDIAARSLWRDGVRVDLSPTVFDCIAYLIGHRERAIGRDELVAAVWGKSTISDTMLGKAILAARRAIGDTAEAQALIRTIPRFGYHWVGAVAEETLADDATVPATPLSGSARAPAAEHPASRTQRLRAAAVVLALLAAAAGVLVLLQRHTGTGVRSTAGTPADAKSPAALAVVLPVDVVGGGDDAWLRRGAMDLVAHRLRASGVPVMNSDSVVSLLRQDGASAATVAAAVRRDDPHAELIQIALARSGRGWNLHAQVSGAGAARTIDTHADEAIEAAREAADRLAALLGGRITERGATEPLALEALLQQTEAARLADRLDDARALLAGAPAALQALPEVRLRAAQIDIRSGRFDPARQQLEALLAAVSAESDPVLRARVLVSLANAQGQLDQPQAAIASTTEAIALVESRDAFEPLAIAYNNRAITHSRQRDFDAAAADFARARVAFERTGDRIALIRVDANEASAMMARGRPADALPVLLRAGQRFEQFGLLNEALIAITNEVDAYRTLLQPADALAASERGWALLQRVQDANLQHHFKRERAAALAENGRTAEAHALLEELIGSVDAQTETTTLGLARESQAELELAAGQAATAAVLAAQAMGALPTPQYQQPRANAALTEIRALRRLGRLSEANAELVRLHNWADDAHAPLVALYAELASAERTPELGPNAPATMHFEEAQRIAADLNVPYLVAAVAAPYGTALIAAGELERAAVVVGRIARYAENDFGCAVLQARLYRALGQREPWQNALARSRTLAGERPLPQGLADLPQAGLGSTPPASGK